MRNEKPLEGRVALVTGATRGIGKGIAIELAIAGAKVYFTGRSTDNDPQNPGTLAATQEEIARAGGLGVGLRCDHHEDTQVAEVFDRIRGDEGRIDVLVNNATAEMGTMVGKRFWELPLDLWQDVIGVGLRSHYVASWHAAPMMIEQANGLIINVSSHGSREYLMGVIYGVGKAGVDKLTTDMAHELRDHGIAVTSIWPGMCKSENRLVNAETLPDGRVVLFGLDLQYAESPAFPGRGVVALATDEDPMARTGQSFWVKDLALEYGFTDIDGTIPDAEKLHASLKQNAPDYWADVVGH
ncbi:MAG: SDR family NAD(P)-dependent oxidoreductase [bacterium]|nr:short-chain dehydrogenase [Deltaproteobacteria bacterium]MCP4903969.1 SDR family NAD(P)-dependent oxidoreductase [bacterium]